MKLERIALAVAVVSLTVSQPARADIRVWEQNAPVDPNAAAAEPASPAPLAVPPEASVPDASEPTDAEDSVVATEPMETPEATVTPEVASVPSADAPSGDHRYLDLTGYVQPGFIFRFADENAGITDSTFWLQRARTGLRAQLTNWLRMRVEIEFAPTPSLQDAYLDLVVTDALQFRIGQFLVPFLLAFQFNELNLGFLDRPIFTPLSPERPFVRYLSPRDIGATINGRVGNLDPERRSPTFEYAAGVFLGRGPNQNQNNDEAFLYALRMQLHVLGRPVGADAESDIARNVHPRVAVGAGLYSNCDDRTNWNRGFTFDSEARFRGLYASASVIWFRNGAAPGSGVGNFLGGDRCVGSYLDAMGQPADFVTRGAHVQLQYVLPTALFPVRNQALEVMARYDWVDAVSPYSASSPVFGGGENSPGYIAPGRLLDSDNPPTQWRMTFGINYFPTHRQSLRVSLNYQLNREAEAIDTADGEIVGVRNDHLWLQITAGL